jgi:hypothetical protein
MSPLYSISIKDIKTPKNVKQYNESLKIIIKYETDIYQKVYIKLIEVKEKYPDFTQCKKMVDQITNQFYKNEYVVCLKAYGILYQYKLPKDYKIPQEVETIFDYYFLIYKRYEDFFDFFKPKWSVYFDKDEIDDSVTYSFINENDKGKALIIRFNPQEMEILINWNDYIGSSDSLKMFTRFGTNKANEEYWQASTTGKASFCPEPDALIQEMLINSKVTFRVYEYSGTPITTEFDLNGLVSILEENSNKNEIIDECLFVYKTKAEIFFIISNFSNIVISATNQLVLIKSPNDAIKLIDNTISRLMKQYEELEKYTRKFIDRLERSDLLVYLDHVYDLVEIFSGEIEDKFEEECKTEDSLLNQSLQSLFTYLDDETQKITEAYDQ